MRYTNGVATIKNRQKIQQRIEMLISPLQAEEFMNIVSEKTGTNMVNVDKVLHLGKKQMMLLKYGTYRRIYCQYHKNRGYNEEK